MAQGDPAERLLNLIIALSNTRVRMSRAQIREAVAGYEPARPGDDAAAAKKRDAAFERMFERDKEDLRRLGIPLRTVTDATHGDEIGYVIDAGEAAMPAIELTAAERAVLAVAAGYWQSAALGTDARRALTKLSSAAERGSAGELALGATTLHDADAAAPLAQAIGDRQAVSFTYTSQSSGRAVRTVEPWRLVVRGGAVYLVGFDRDRGEPRTYRTSRIEGAPEPVGEPGAFEPPANLPASQLTDAVPGLVARVGVRAESGHSLRRRGSFVKADGVWDVFDVPYSDTEALRDEVLALAGGARVIEPASLADMVVSHAAKAREAAHG